MYFFPKALFVSLTERTWKCGATVSTEVQDHVGASLAHAGHQVDRVVIGPQSDMEVDRKRSRMTRTVVRGPQGYSESDVPYAG